MNKKLIRLTESDLHRIVKESVNKVLNEITYDGVKYDGRNKYDWEDLSNIRLKRFAKNLSDKDLKAYQRNHKNAKDLGYEYGDTRLDGAKRAFNQGNSQLADFYLGDVDGRAQQSINAIKRSREALENKKNL